MANKVDIPEVTDFSNDLQEASDDFRSQLDKVKESIETINGMRSFSGQAAKEAKRYFDELHLTLLESFRGLFDDLEGNLEQHIKTFASNVDVSDSAIIKSNYLQDVKEDINDVFEDLTKQDEIIHDTIQGVSDISSATPPSFLDVDEWKKKTIKKIRELDEDLASFTSVGDETDVKAIMNQIEAAMNNAKTSEGKARFSDFEGASQMSELKKLQDYNEDKKDIQMDKAKEAKDSALQSQMESSSKEIVNRAYQEYKNGDITFNQYMEVVDATNDLPYIEEPNKFYDQIIDNLITNTKNATVTDGISTGLEAGGVQAKNLTESIRYYAATWGPNTQNSFVMYSKNASDKSSQIIKGANAISKIGKFGVPIIGGAIDFFTMTAQGEDVGDAAIKSGAHVGIGIGGAATGAAIGATIGSVVPIGGTIVGGAIGFASGVVITAVGNTLFDTIYDNREQIYDTITDAGENIIDTVEEGVKSVGNAVNGFINGLGTVFS